MKLAKQQKQAILEEIPDESVFHFIEEGVVQDVISFKAYVTEVLKGKMDAENRALLEWIKRVIGNTYVGINISNGKVMGFDNMKREYDIGEEIEYEEFQ